jgi:hypothetical protein
MEDVLKVGEKITIGRKRLFRGMELLVGTITNYVDYKEDDYMGLEYHYIVITAQLDNGKKITINAGHGKDDLFVKYKLIAKNK